jgi:hypothetical protein
MLRELAPDRLWVAETPMPRGGFDFGARMTVVRLAGDALLLHSPVAMTAALKDALDQRGAVRALVAPSSFHYMHLSECARAYPDARVYVPPRFRRQLPGVTVHGRLGDTPTPEWAGVLEQSAFRGSALYDEVDFFHAATRTLILTDLLFHFPGKRSLAGHLITGLFGLREYPAPARSFALFARDHAAIRDSLERLLAWDFDRIIVSHGEIVESGGKAAFRRAFARFLG